MFLYYICFINLIEPIYLLKSIPNGPMINLTLFWIWHFLQKKEFTHIGEGLWLKKFGSSLFRCTGQLLDSFTR